MTARVGYVLSALLLGVGALVGVQYSGATFTDDSNLPAQVTAAADWAAPSVTVSPLEPGIFGTVTVTATATDDRSDIGDVVLEYSLAGSNTWVPLTTGCTASSGPSPLVHSCQWDTLAVDDGDYEVRATATDTANPIAFTGVSASVPTQVANDASVVLTTIPSPTRGSVTLTGALLNAGNGSRSIRFEYAVAGSGSWQAATGCAVGSTSEYTCSFNTTGLNGSYDVRAVGARGGGDFYDVQTAVLIDNTAPTASLTAPGGVLSGPVELTVDASDAHTSIAAVTIEYKRQGDAGWAQCGAPTSAPYVCTLDSTSVSDGTYDFRATATDAAGNTSPVSTQTREISNAAGSVEITLPSAGATVSGSMVSVAASADSPRGVASVTLQYRSGSTGSFTDLCPPDTSSPYACPWDVSALSNGAYQLRAVLTEVSGTGVVTSDVVGVTVNNSLGSVVFTSPTVGATVTGTVALAATAQPASGKTVQSVKFYGPGGVTGPALCTGTLTTGSSYGCNWSSAAVVFNNAYQLDVVLTHGDGTQVTSSVIVKVDNVVGSVSVAVSTPVPGYVRGSVTVDATTSSNAPISSVQLMARTNLNGSFTPVCDADTVAPYSCPWNAAVSYAASEVQAVATLANGSTVTSNVVAVIVDNRVLAGADVQATNGNSTPGAGDTIVLTYGGLVDLATIRTGLSGTPTSFTGLGIQGGTGQNLDRLVFPAGINLGSVVFSQDYVTGNNLAAFTGSSISATTVTVGGRRVTQVTIVLGTTSSNSIRASSLPGAMTWTPSASAKDLFGTPSLTTTVTESGASDADL